MLKIDQILKTLETNTSKQIKELCTTMDKAHADYNTFMINSHQKLDELMKQEQDHIKKAEQKLDQQDPNWRLTYRRHQEKTK